MLDVNPSSIAVVNFVWFALHMSQVKIQNIKGEEYRYDLSQIIAKSWNIKTTLVFDHTQSSYTNTNLRLVFLVAFHILEDFKSFFNCLYKIVNDSPSRSKLTVTATIRINEESSSTAQHTILVSCPESSPQKTWTTCPCAWPILMGQRVTFEVRTESGSFWSPHAAHRTYNPEPLLEHDVYLAFSKTRTWSLNLELEVKITMFVHDYS